MKVVHVINSLGKGGAEKLLSDLLPLIQSEKYEVECIVLTSHNDVYSDSLKDYLKIDFLTQETNLKKLSVFKKLKKELSKRDADIYHVHLFPGQYYVPFVTNKPKVFTEHSTISKRRHSILKPLEKMIYNRYRKFIYVSESAKESYLEFLGVKDSYKNLVIYNGINLDRINEVGPVNIKEQFNLNSNEKVIMMVSSFKKEKDHKTLIKAILNEENWHLFLLGEGHLQDDIIDFVNQNNLTHRVHFIGFKENVYGWLKGADVVIQSSYQEGFGLGILEAMACGKPVLASDISGLDEVVNNPLYRFKVGDSENLESKIKYLFNSNQQKIAVEYSLNRAKEFNITQTAKQYQQVYEEVK